jgi:hypothetical protein
MPNTLLGMEGKMKRIPLTVTLVALFAITLLGAALATPSIPIPPP